MKPKEPCSPQHLPASVCPPVTPRRPEPVETLLSRVTGQRGSPDGKGRVVPAAPGSGKRAQGPGKHKDKRRAVSNKLQSRRRSSRGRKAA